MEILKKKKSTDSISLFLDKLSKHWNITFLFVYYQIIPMCLYFERVEVLVL